MSSPETELPCAVGDVIDGRYRIDAIRASGGMGHVFQATHLLLARPVALKVISSKMMKLPGVAARFVREARLATQLESPHIVKVFDVAVLPGGVPYLVMEWLEGRDLAQILARFGPLPVETAIDYILQACEALAEVHARGIVHRDLKPSNLFVTRGRDGLPNVKLIDFGVSKVELASTSASSRITQTGTALGSPSYMSPEQMSGAEDADSRTDVWGLGVVLFELLTQALPFGSGTLAEIFARIVVEPPPEPLELRPGLPPGLARVMMRCLHADPPERFQTVEALAEALVEFGGPESAARLPRIVDIGRAARRTPLPKGVTCGARELNEVVAKSEPPPPHMLDAAPGPKKRGRSRLPLLAIGGLAATFALFGEVSRRHAPDASAAPLVPAATAQAYAVEVAATTSAVQQPSRGSALVRPGVIAHTTMPPSSAASAMADAPSHSPDVVQ